MYEYHRTVSVPDKIYALIKNTANTRKCSMSRLVSKAILELLKKDSIPVISKTANDKLIIEIKFDKN
jgi:hypothetical protein